jgi:hypothetical protein
MRTLISTRRLRLICECLVLVCVVWATAVAVTGGVATEVLGMRLSSRNPGNPLMLAALLAAAAAWLARPRVYATLRADAADIARTSLLPVALAVAWLHLAQWHGGRPFWLDEEMIALNLRGQTLTGLAHGLWLDQSAPFGWLAVERTLLVVFGDGERSLRLLPLLSGLATLAAALWIGRRWLGMVGTLCLVALVGTTQWLGFYVHQLKPYSGDVLWGLLLPALAAWAADTNDPTEFRRRFRAWWLTAATAQWFALGALFVVPGCGAILLVLAWSRARPRELAHVIAPLLIWVVSFAALYLITLRPASHNPTLQDYWAFALAPVDGTWWQTGRWVLGRFDALAIKPGGTTFPLLFWTLAIAGWGLTRSTLSAMVAVAPITAAALAITGVVPLFERLSLWMIPAAMVGIAQAVSWAVHRPHQSWAWMPRAVVLAGAVVLVWDVVPRGYHELTTSPVTNHGLDDRTAVQWLLSQHRPGSVIVATTLSQPAIWWYGRASLSATNRGATLDAGTPVLHAGFTSTDQPCPPPPAFPGNRLLVYLGFRVDDLPAGFDQLLLDTLTSVGRVSTLRDFGGIGRAAVVDLGVPSPAPQLTTLIGPAGARAKGCVTFAPAERW